MPGLMGPGLDPPHVHGTIATATIIGLGIKLDPIAQAQRSEGDVFKGGAVEVHISPGAPVDEPEPAIAQMRDGPMSHGVPRFPPRVPRTRLYHGKMRGG
jgi:hypothetical protein